METMRTTLDYGKRYRLLRVSGEVVEGEHIQTKGNEADYPTFRMGDGGLLSVASANVLGPADETCSVEGIARP